MDKISILGVDISNAKKEEDLEFIIKGLHQKTKKQVIFTPNPEIIMFAQKDKEFKKILNSADLALPDGVGVVWGAKMLGKQLQQRITGVDFMEELCREAAKRGFTVGLIGGGPKIAEKTAECLRHKYSGLDIGYAVEEWSQEHSGKSVDILFVALGFPKQERFVMEHKETLPADVFMTVGGAFDYISGAVLRAPIFLRQLGLEWLFRLFVQPWRFKRQLVLLWYIYSIFATKFRQIGKQYNAS